MGTSRAVISKLNSSLRFHCNHAHIIAQVDHKKVTVNMSLEYYFPKNQNKKYYYQRCIQVIIKLLVKVFIFNKLVASKKAIFVKKKIHFKVA